MLHSLIPLSVLLGLSHGKNTFRKEDEDLNFGRCILVVRQVFKFHYIKENSKNNIFSFAKKEFKIKMLVNYKPPMK